jgi:hypothetical protein
MTDERAGNRYAPGLLVDLRGLCRKIDDNNYRIAAELHDLLRKVARPNVHDLENELTFRVQQTEIGSHGETLHTISLEGDMEVARATFRVAVRCCAIHVCAGFSCGDRTSWRSMSRGRQAENLDVQCVFRNQGLSRDRRSGPCDA